MLPSHATRSATAELARPREQIRQSAPICCNATRKCTGWGFTVGVIHAVMARHAQYDSGAAACGVSASRTQGKG